MLKFSAVNKTNVFFVFEGLQTCYCYCTEIDSLLLFQWRCIAAACSIEGVCLYSATLKKMLNLTFCFDCGFRGKMVDWANDIREHYEATIFFLSIDMYNVD